MRIIVLIFLLAFVYGDELQFVGAIIRHGARSSLIDIPALRDKVNWPMGTGQLTPSGQRQHYLLGRELRKRYIETEKLLKPKYDPSELYSRSTYYHRTAMSAQSFLFGLYPDGLDILTNNQLKKKEIWNPPLKLDIPDYVIDALGNTALPYNATMIPVRTFTKQNEKLLGFGSCPVYDYYRKSFYKTPEFRELVRRYDNSFAEACWDAGLDCDKVTGFEYFDYTDYFLSAEFDGQFPKLTSDGNITDELLEFYTQLMIGELTINSVMKSIAMHEFSKVFPELFENSTKGGYKMVVLGTHDSTVLAYLLALGVDRKKYEKIPYAANIIIELRKKGKAQIVNVLYNGENVLSLTKEQFNAKIKDIGKIDDWDSVCNNPIPSNITRVSNDNRSYHFVIAIGICVLLGLLVVLICKSKKSYEANEV